MKRPSTHMGYTTGLSHTAYGLPSLKQQLALLRSRLTKVYPFGVHALILPESSRCEGCS